MCVICTAAKKRYMKREEVAEAMRTNSSGFFGFTVRDGGRKTIRTLDKDEFMAFFDSVGDDDPWVMHARIPSRGGQTLDNVHGWEEDGIIFCHNMTIYQMDGMMENVGWKGTDSEFFFRHIFMPFYRGCGEDAYKDGKFCGDLDNIVRHFAGTGNKFLFIMPDNRLIYYGDWVTEKDRVGDNGEELFKASNRTYEVHTKVYPSYQRSWYYGSQNDDDDDDYCGGLPHSVSFDTGQESGNETLRKGGEETREVLGDGRVARMVLVDLVTAGVLHKRTSSASLILRDFVPSQLSTRSYRAAVQGCRAIARAKDRKEAGEEAEKLLKAYSESVYVNLYNSGGARVERDATQRHVLQRGYCEFLDEWAVFSELTGTGVDFDAKSPRNFACAAMKPVRRPYSRKWNEGSYDAVQLLSAVIGGETDGAGKVNETQTALKALLDIAQGKETSNL